MHGVPKRKGCPLGISLRVEGGRREQQPGLKVRRRARSQPRATSHVPLSGSGGWKKVFPVFVALPQRVGEEAAPLKASPAVQGILLRAQAAGLRLDVRVVDSAATETG